MFSMPHSAHSITSMGILPSPPNGLYPPPPQRVHLKHPGHPARIALPCCNQLHTGSPPTAPGTSAPAATPAPPASTAGQADRSLPATTQREPAPFPAGPARADSIISAIVHTVTGSSRSSGSMCRVSPTVGRSACRRPAARRGGVRERLAAAWLSAVVRFSLQEYYTRFRSTGQVGCQDHSHGPELVCCRSATQPKGPGSPRIESLSPLLSHPPPNHRSAMSFR